MTEKSQKGQAILVFVKNEIYFPKQQWKSFVFRYASAAFFTSLALLANIFFQFEHGVATSYLIFILAIVFSSWIGSLGPGLLSTGISVLSLLFVFSSLPALEARSVLDIYIFFAAGIAISAVVDVSKRMDLISVYNTREINYQKLIAQLTKENDETKKEIKVRDEFLSIASHELKTPLTSTLLKLQMVLYNVRNVSLAKFSVQNLLQMLESAEQQTQRLSKMINDLLNVSLIRTGRMDLELEKADLSEITKDVVSRFTEKADKEKVKITMDAAKPVPGRFDTLRIEQAVTNLISNAIKYGNRKPIEVKVQKTGVNGKIIVKDHGIGIPAKQRDKIFYLFERAVDNTTYHGMGVGLYIANQIIKAHKGSIDVRSEAGNGTTFTIALPLN